jgi:hypothetical protein
MTECGKNNFRVAAELAPPQGLKRLLPGDFVDIEIEQVIIPSKASLYYGPNMDFAVALERDVNTWKMVRREAAGNDLKVAMREGTLLQSYPIEIAVSVLQKASFSITGGIGYAPITFTGLKNYKGYKLSKQDGDKLTPVEQGLPDTGFWQTDYDNFSQTWSMTFNINLDSATLKAYKSFVFSWE